MLMEKLKLDAGEPVYEKAIAHYQSGAIKSFNFTQSGKSRYQIKAIVKAPGAFGVNLNLDFNNGSFKISHFCTCSSGSDTLCEHAAAVIYKFLADDFPKLNPGLIKPAQPEGIGLLRQIAAAPAEKTALIYEIGGLDSQSEQFTLTFSIPEDSDPCLGQLVNCLGDLNYSVRKREQILDSLTDFDYLIISALETKLSGKDPGRQNITIPKSKQSLQLVLVLAQNAKATLHSQPLKLGESLKPKVYVTGDETRLQFSYDQTEFELSGYFDRDLNYLINDYTMYPINTACLEKIQPEIVIAPEQLGEVLFEILPRLDAKIRLELAPELRSHHLVRHEPELSLNLDYQQGQIVCRPEIKLLDRVYHDQECQSLLIGEPTFERSPSDPQQWFTIDRRPFRELTQFLRSYQFQFTAADWVIKDQEPQLQFMLHGLQQMVEKWPLSTSPKLADFKVTPVKLEPLVQLDLDAKIDWFDFQISYNLGGQTYTHQQIISMLRRFGSGNYLQIGNQWFLIDELIKFDLLENTFEGLKTGPTGAGREKLYNLAFLRELLGEHGIAIKGNSVYDRFEADITRNSLIRSNPIPESFQGELRSYQKEGFDWLHFLYKYHFGGILADEMGLGKTIQVLTLIKSLPKMEPVLIVCPRSLIYNWAAELDKFFPGTARLVYHGSPETRATLLPTFRDYEIVITTYDVVVNDIEALRDCSFYYLILDEAQHIKNRQTQRAKDCKQLQARYRLVLTGTPVENRLEDLWALFDFLMPGYLGSQTEFKEEYVAPLKTKKQLETLALLRKKVAPFMLRRLKEDVLAELPPKIHFTRNVAMTQLQDDVYRSILKQVKQEVLTSVSDLGLNKSRITVLSALTKLRQVCDHPGLAVPEIGMEADSGKIDALMELIDEAIDGGHKIVIFSQFVRMLKLVRTKLQEAGINYAYLDGHTTDRMDRINYFNNNPAIPIFLISLKAGGVGINLTAADIVIHADPWWNPMVENQATDRVHRIGQQKTVLVYKLVTMGTVEEKLIRLQERKQALFDAIIQNNGDPMGSLTWEEIKELFEIAE